ncbi:MAG: hypothetical protein C0601_03980 [Candidatus Muiribacterium halophilum]|uniref:Uncharacterized protein n=1 Tax=Muiribacterium halophilum TaxID=2053465 RepID=A0A2N5ZJF1_MUIH1|nr:MAG: hypothetical protein C0601_03980 [Candidatus Muirbacterium halophilum]
MTQSYYEYWINGIIEDGSESPLLFHLLVDSEEEKVLKFIVAPVTRNVLSEIDLEESIINFEKRLRNSLTEMDDNGPLAETVSLITQKFPESLTGEKMKKIFEFITTSRDPFLKNVLVKDLIEDIIKKFLKKGNIKTELKFSLTNPEENIMDIINENTGEESQENNTTKVKIKLKPILDPVSGISANKISTGDEIDFKVNNANLDFEKLSSYLKKDDSDFSKKVYTSIVNEISRMEESGSIYIRTDVSDLYVGEMVLQEELKITAKKKDKIDEAVKDLTEGEYDEDEKQGSSLIYIVSGVVFILILILVYFLL